MSFIQPEAFALSFTCPSCSAISQQTWWSTDWDKRNNMSKHQDPIRVAHCVHCDNHSVWIFDMMVYPDNGNAPSPNDGMPDSVKIIYLEACSIYQKSPRGAAALLRLAIQMLCKELGESGANINNDIKNLVSKGLPEIVQRSLDIVRVTGNDAVHPGQIDTDDHNTVGSLFKLTNIVVEYMITLPKQVDSLYDALPTDKVAAITNRDKNN